MMKEIVGDMWQEHAEGAVVAITTNGAVNKVGRAIMLRGCARQARVRYPELLQTLGELLRRHGNHVFDLGHQIVSFPVEVDPYQVPEMRMIDQSCRELVELTDYKGWQKVGRRLAEGCRAATWLRRWRLGMARGKDHS